MEIQSERWSTPGVDGGAVLEGTRYAIADAGRIFLISVLDTAPGDAMFEGEIVDGELKKYWTMSIPLPAGASPVGELSPLPRGDEALANVLEYLRTEKSVERLTMYSARDNKVILEALPIVDAVGVIGSEIEDFVLPRIALDVYLEGSDAIVRRPWSVPGHSVYLVRYDGAMQTFLAADEVGDRWDYLYREALANLQKFMLERTQVSGDGPVGEAGIVEFSGHGAVTSFPLLPAFAANITAYAPDAELFAIPDKDRIIFFARSRLDDMAERIQAGFDTARQPVSPHVYRFDGEQVTIEREQEAPGV